MVKKVSPKFLSYTIVLHFAIQFLKTSMSSREASTKFSQRDSFLLLTGLVYPEKARYNKVF